MTDQSTTGRLQVPRPPRDSRPTDGRNRAAAKAESRAEAKAETRVESRAGTSAAVPSGRAGWLVPAGLLLLSFVPVLAGAIRVTELAGAGEITPENARFFASPVPVVLHIICVTTYSILGAFQFAPGFRRRRPAWHRAAGRLLVPCGLIAALTGLWMTLFYPWPDGDGVLVAGFRLVFGTAMAASIVLGLTAIRRRDIARHRAWMMRGYAIGLGAGSQALTHLPWFLFVGKPGEIPRAMLMAAGWVINLAVAEWFIRRRPARAVARRS